MGEVYKLVIKPHAELDIVNSMKWYEGKQVGLGSRFLKDLDQKLLKVASNPFHYQVRYKSIVRMAFLDVFQDAVHFTIEENTIYVHALLGTSQDPQLWK